MKFSAPVNSDLSELLYQIDYMVQSKVYVQNSNSESLKFAQKLTENAICRFSVGFRSLDLSYRSHGPKLPRKHQFHLKVSNFNKIGEINGQWQNWSDSAPYNLYQGQPGTSQTTRPFDVYDIDNQRNKVTRGFRLMSFLTLSGTENTKI